MIVRLGVVALALAALGTAASAETLREQSDATLDAAGIRVLDVENSRGLIEVRPGTGNRIRVRAIKVVRAPDRGRAEEISRQLRVEMSSVGDRKLVRVRYPQRMSFRVGFFSMLKGDVEFPLSEVRLAFEIPERLEVRLRSSSGDVASEDLAGLQTLESSSGDLSVRGARGPVTARSSSGSVSGSFEAQARVRTSSGDIVVERARGALDANSSSGRVVVEEAADSVLVSTTSGDIEVRRAARGARASSSSGGIRARVASGSVDLRTTSGDIGVWLGPGLRGARIESGSGAIGVRVAPGLGVAFDVRTSSGDIESGIGLRVASSSRRTLTGVVGSGAVPVRLTSTSGDIQITSGGE